MIHQFPIGRNFRAGTVSFALYRLIAVWILALLLPASADLNGPAYALAPSVEDISNLPPVVRGKVIRIKLEASTESPARMEFVLGKNLLKHGTLSEVKIPDPEKKHIATINYTPFREGPDATDTFTYMVRQPGKEGRTMVSPTATVTLQVLAAFPELVANDVLEFGEVFVGSSSNRLLIASNLGGAPFRQKLVLPPGFTATGLDENNVLQLDPEETKQITLTFHPVSTGRVQQRISYPGNRGETSQTLLYATGVAPFHAAPSKLQLEWVPEEEARFAKLELTSSMDRPITIQVDAPQALNLPATISLGKRGVTAIDINIPADRNKNAVIGDIRLSFEDFKLTVPVHSEGLPAYLAPTGKTQTGRTINFPEGAMSPPAVLKFTNKGTKEGTLYTDIHHEFLLEGVTEGQIITPGDQLELTIKPAHNITAAGTFVLKCGDQRLEYDVLSERGRRESSAVADESSMKIEESTALLGSKGGTATRSFVDVSARKSGPALAAELFSIRVEGAYTFDHSLAKVTHTQFEDGGRHFLEFSWEPLSPGNFDYRIHVERMRIDKETERPMSVWKLMPSKIELIDGRYHARMENLLPGMAYRVRIVGLTQDNRASLSEPFRFVTAVPRHLGYLIGTWAVTLMTITSIAYFIYRKVQKRRHYQRYY